MIVGVPKEVKSDEYRVAMLPVGAEELTAAGHTVLIEEGAGLGSGILDAQYSAAGRDLRARRGDDLETGRPRREGQGAPGVRVAPHAGGPDPVHLFPLRRRREADPGRDRERDHRHRLRDDSRRQREHCPLLTPMSEVAGRMSIQEGREIPRAAPGRARDLAGGRSWRRAGRGRRARRRDRRLERCQGGGRAGANVKILDINLDRLRYLDDIMPPNVTTLYSDRHTILRVRRSTADLVIGRHPDHRGPGPSARPPRGSGPDEAGRGDRGCRDRPGGLHRDQPSNHPPRPDLRDRRCGPLLRHQHAGRGRPDQHLRLEQRDASLMSSSSPGNGWEARWPRPRQASPRGSTSTGAA